MCRIKPMLLCIGRCPAPHVNRCFSRFVDRFAPYIFSGTAGEGGRKTFAVLEAHLELLDQLLWYHDPALAVRMEECRMHPDAYATPWWVQRLCLSTTICSMFHER